MKNFVKHTLAIAICAAALLSSCIKEEAYVRETAELSVNLTRAGTSSTVQGDAIKDAWIWAFQCKLNDTTGAPSLEDTATPVGGRYVSGLNSYGNISVHVPLPICNGEQDYLLVAVINTEAYGNLNLTANSTWGTIKSATFDQTGAFWSTYPKDEEKTPEVMPVSNWTTFTIKDTNVHSSNCYQLNLPVYRTVAKAQLFMSKAGDFDLQVLDAKVVATNEYSNGKVLTANSETATGSNSEAIQRGLPSESATTWWWGTPTAKTANKGYAMKNSDGGFTTTGINTKGNATNPENGVFTWVASTFLLENNNDAPYGTGCYDSAQGSGYNLYVKYQVGEGTPVEVYTPLGKVVRNHDYQVKATVNAGGQMTFKIVVNEWLLDVQEYNYQDIATITNDGHIKWSNLPTVSGYNAIDADTGQVKSGVINLTANEGASGKFTFTLATPLAGNWIAELRTVKGTAGAIVFADGSTVMTGLIDNQPNELTIKNLAYNSAGAGGVQNEVELHIYATAYWGDVLRSYRVEGIVGNDVTFQDYKIIQPTGM